MSKIDKLHNKAGRITPILNLGFPEILILLQLSSDVATEVDISEFTEFTV